MQYLLGIDIGTSSARTILIDTDGNILGLASKEYPISIPMPDWAEQDPETWWDAAKDTIRQVLSKSGVDSRSIKGIGLSGQMHGTVFVDREGNCLRPAIIWPDKRSARECQELADAVGPKRLYEISGLPVATGFMATSLLWVKHNEPDILRKTSKLLLPKDYVRLRLTGKVATDLTDATGTLLLDITKRAWSGEVVKAVGIPPDILPNLLESSAIAGEITSQAAKETGLAMGTPVIAGGGDQAMGAIGSGVIKDGIAASTIGTGGQLITCVSRPVLDPKRRLHTLCHAVPGKWLLMGAILAAGLSLRWFRDKFGYAEKLAGELTGIDPYEILSREAAKVPAGSDGLIFLPYLSGERTPHMDPQARGAFVGLTLRHGRGHMIRAIMEGVSFAMKESLEIFRELGVSVDKILCSGGGARSRLWRQIQADIYDMPVTIVGNEEHSVYGCALLAGVGAGIYRDIEEACDGRVQYTDTVRPQDEWTQANQVQMVQSQREPSPVEQPHVEDPWALSANACARYRALFEVYRSLYPRLRDIFPEL
ncbi:MAG: xylulokinase [Firmicutes bacterium]|nr:xylulokinase [Bacillota bacterium]